MKRAYKYKMKPTVGQRQKLSRFFGCVRFIYNWGLDRKIKAYTESKNTLTYFQLAKELTFLKKEEEHKWLADCANESLQQSLRCLDNAYTNFFRNKKGFPKFKAKKCSKDVCKFINGVRFDFVKWRVKVPKVGWIRLCPNREFDQSVCKTGTLTVSRDRCGDYWCVVVVEDGQPSVSKAKIREETSVGIDLGIKDYAVLSDGTKYGNPKFLEKGQSRLALLQKRFARTQKGSNRHEAMRVKVARQYRRIANRRSDFLHKLTSDLLRRFDTICLEDLNVEGMMRNHNLARSIQSAAWSEFVRQLTYKAEWHGKNLVFIGRFEPSSQICHVCGYRSKDVKDLSVREWVCPECGTRHDRDVNAARNILRFGLHPQALVAIENKVPSGSGIKDGEGNDISHPVKRQYSKSELS